MKYTFAQLEDLWTQVGGNPIFKAVAAAVAMAESGGNSDAINGSNSNGSIDRGLWQINSIHGSQSTTDPTANARAAVNISKNGSNWRPWCVMYANGGCSGAFLGSTAPVFRYLPPGVDVLTGGTVTGDGGSPLVTASPASIPFVPNPLNPLGTLFGFIWGTLTGETQKDVLAGIGMAIANALKWMLFVIAGMSMMFVGVFLLLWSTNLAKAVGRSALGIGEMAAGWRLGVGRTPTAGPVPAGTAPAPAPAPTPAPAPAALPAGPNRPAPLFLDRPGTPARRRLAASEDATRRGMAPPPKRPRTSRRKATTEYEGRHRGE